MDATELCYLSGGQLSRLIGNKEVSCVEVAEAHLARCQALEPSLNSFITLLPDQAIAAARRADEEIAEGRFRGPLHGIPLGLKDLYYVKGVRNTSGSRIFGRFHPGIRQYDRRQVQTGGSYTAGEAKSTPVRLRPYWGKPGLRPYAQPVES